VARFAGEPPPLGAKRGLGLGLAVADAWVLRFREPLCRRKESGVCLVRLASFYPRLGKNIANTAC
jgi:hypothetical protein